MGVDVPEEVGVFLGSFQVLKKSSSFVMAVVCAAGLAASGMKRPGLLY